MRAEKEFCCGARTPCVPIVYVNLHFSIFIQRLKSSFHLNGDTSGSLTQPQTIAKVLQSSVYKITLRTTRFFLLLPGKMSPVLAGRGRNSGIRKFRYNLYKNPRLLAFLHLPRDVRHGLEGKQEICQEIKRLFLRNHTAFLTSPLSAEFY